MVAVGLPWCAGRLAARAKSPSTQPCSLRCGGTDLFPAGGNDQLAGFYTVACWKFAADYGHATPPDLLACHCTDVLRPTATIDELGRKTQPSAGLWRWQRSCQPGSSLVPHVFHLACAQGMLAYPAVMSPPF
jgi:hypothetical protein